MRLKLWEKYAFFVAYVRADQLAKPAQPRPRLKHDKVLQRARAVQHVRKERVPRRLRRASSLARLISRSSSTKCAAMLKRQCSSTRARVSNQTALSFPAAARLASRPITRAP